LFVPRHPVVFVVPASLRGEVLSGSVFAVGVCNVVGNGGIVEASYGSPWGRGVQEPKKI